MGEITASYTATETSFHVEGYEKIEFDLLYVDGAFAVENTEIADSYRAFGRTASWSWTTTVHGLYRQTRSRGTSPITASS